MKIKMSKKRLQEIIQEEYAFHEKRKRQLKENTTPFAIEEEELSEEELAEAIAEVMAETGLGDGTKMGGNYSTGFGGSQGESPDQTLPGGKE